MLILLALSIGFVSGLRSMLPGAVLTLGAWSGMLHVDHTPFAFIRSGWLTALWCALAIGELIGDKLPVAPSRKSPGPFVARIVSGSISGAVIGASLGALALGAVAGAVGAVAGTLLGYSARMSLAAKFGRDLPAALVEDAFAIGVSAAVLIILRGQA
jgi:uncharacterized membrane protein